MTLTVLYSGSPGGVMFCQLLPLSREICTRPSSLPAQSRPAVAGDSSNANTVEYTSTPVLSRVIPSPPEKSCFFLSLRVRSGLIFSHVCPPSFDRCTYCEVV